MARGSIVTIEVVFFLDLLMRSYKVGVLDLGSLLDLGNLPEPGEPDPAFTVSV